MEELLGATISATFTAISAAFAALRELRRSLSEHGTAALPRVRLALVLGHLIACVPLLIGAGRVFVAGMQMWGDETLLFFVLIIGIPLTLGSVMLALLLSAGEIVGAAGALSDERLHQAVGVVTALAGGLLGVMVCSMGFGSYGWALVLSNGVAFVLGAGRLVQAGLAAWRGGPGPSGPPARRRFTI